MAQTRHVLPADCIISDAGIDWLTLTTTNPRTKKGMYEYFGHIVAADLISGYAVATGGAHGFVGKRCRHALFAHRDDRSLLQVSGARAARTLTLCREGDNATRLDIQITVRVGQENVQKVLRASEKAFLTYTPKHGKRADVPFNGKNGKLQTVYSGSRSSDIFVRVYDKFAESKEEEYRGCVRFEVETKGKVSRALWAHMASTGAGTMYLLRVLVGILASRGLDLSGLALDAAPIPQPKEKPLKEERLLAWLDTQVSRAVARVSAARGWAVPFLVLFQHACNEVDRRVIMETLSIAY